MTLPPLLIVFLLTFLATIILFALTWFILVDRPVRELIREMAEAPAKNFLNRAHIRRFNLIGHLARSFNVLLEQITTLDAFKIQTERDLILAQEELKYRHALEDKNRIIEETNRDLEARLKELSLLHDFSHEISTSLEMEDLCHMVENFLGDKLSFEEFAFLNYEEDAERLVVVAASGFSDDSRIRGMSFKMGEGISGQVLQKGKMIYLPDTGLNRDFMYYKGEKRGDGSFLSLPLTFRSRVVGVLNLFRAGKDRFSEARIQFFNTLAGELAIVLMNAKLYSRTKELSVRDELTQLYNRRHFQETLPLEIKRAQRFQRPLVLLMIDIDHFKRFNDEYGHLVGDKILKDLVFLINSRIREVDFFARFGGEEFAMILPNTSKDDGRRVAEKILQLVRSHRFSVGQQYPAMNLTLSVGVAGYPDDGETIEDLLDAADIALYEAKGGGRDRVVVSHRLISNITPEITGLR